MDLIPTRFIKGSANGARFYSTVFLSLLLLAGIPTFASYGINAYAVIFLSTMGAAAVRTWFMGVWLTRDSVRVVGLVRSYHVKYTEIDWVTDERYTGALGIDVGYYPGIGPVRVVTIRLVGDRWREYRSTLGRAGTVRRVCAEIRAAVEARGH